MGFHIIQGTMGGGKTYLGAELIYACLQEGGYVMTNVDLVPEEVERLGWTDKVVMLTGNPSDWKDKLIAGVEGSENCVVIDEAAMLFYVHDAAKNRDTNRPFYELMVWSRKLGLDMYMIAQHADNVDPAIRRAAQYIIHCVNVAKIPFLGAMLKKFMGDFRRVWITPLSLKAVRSTYHRFRPDIGRFYSTEKTAGFQLSLETKATRKKPEESGWKPIISFGLLMLLMVGGGLAVARHQWQKAVGSDKPKEAPSVVKPPAAPDKEKVPENVEVEQDVSNQEKRGGGMIAVEWDSDKEFPVCSAWLGRFGWVVTTSVRRYEVGAMVEGKICVAITRYRDSFFVELEGGEFHVARSLTRGERAESCRLLSPLNSSPLSSPASSPLGPSSSLVGSSVKLAERR
jgi:hypothetical protein